MTDKKLSNGRTLKARVPTELLKAIDDYRHDKRFDSRQDAVVELLQVALATVANGSTTTAQPNQTANGEAA
jgi:hypothetical protein